MPRTDAAWRRVIVEDGALFVCHCGKELDGNWRGPQGGRQWKYVNPDGSENCSPKCAGQSALEHVKDQIEGDWQAEQAAAKYAGEFE